MSRWTHPVCDDCWDRRHPDKPSPRRGLGDPEVCCACRTVTFSGIYVREDPILMLCDGDHEEP